MKKSQLKKIIKEEIKKISEEKQIQDLEQQAKTFVSKYGKVKIKI